MAGLLDPETLQRLRELPPEAAVREVKDAVYQLGAVSSEDFDEVFRELVERGILRLDQWEEFKR